MQVSTIMFWLHMIILAHRLISSIWKLTVAYCLIIVVRTEVLDTIRGHTFKLRSNNSWLGLQYLRILKNGLLFCMTDHGYNLRSPLDILYLRME